MSERQLPTELDLAFEALGNEHRREIVYFLGLQPASITKLASMRGLSLQAIHKHVKLLEEAQLVRRKKLGRTNYLELNPATVRRLQEWLDQFHTYWGSNQASLENYAQFLSKKEEH